jgi:hypothetical protein
MLVRAIMVIACDAANAQRLPSRPSIPIHVAELSAVTKLLQVRVTENVSVPHDADTGQLAHPVVFNFRSLHSDFACRHIGLWRKDGRSELPLVEDTEIDRANYGSNVYHHSMGASVARVFNQRSNNPLNVRTVRLVSVVNEPKTGGVDIGSIANSHGLICSDPLLAGKECSAASCKKRAEQKPEHWIAESPFLRGGAAAMFLGLWLGYRQNGWRLLFGVVLVISGWIIFVFHGLLPSISEDASDFFAPHRYARCLTECRLWFCGPRNSGLTSCASDRSLDHCGFQTCIERSLHAIAQSPHSTL